MDVILIILSLAVYGYFMYKIGRKQEVSSRMIDAIVAKADFPIGIIEQIDGHYYVHEKDTSKFLGQAATLEEIPQKLFDNKVTIALLMYPEKDPGVYWCINGRLKAHQ